MFMLSCPQVTTDTSVSQSADMLQFVSDISSLGRRGQQTKKWRRQATLMTIAQHDLCLLRGQLCVQVSGKECEPDCLGAAEWKQAECGMVGLYMFIKNETISLVSMDYASDSISEISNTSDKMNDLSICNLEPKVVKTSPISLLDQSLCN